ncbi:hypothetical protein [Kistimonas asteriae]|uniref:hypothetical protein n=1 Tax=Kistimonas asteriae TaxID=517724 RepID=UPI001BA8AB81|nr:hypothetical protein [Kistimonas asteriae]
MSRYIKCARDNGLVMSNRLYDRPAPLGNPNIFWVEVQPIANGLKAAWEPNSPEDQLKFQLYQQLPPKGSAPVVVRESQGQWLHTVNSIAARDHESRRHDNEQDRETFRLIKVWCERQDEGCEEAFINLGVENPQHARYQAYREAVSEIKNLRR